jgi:hypothetical protein
MRYIYSAEVKTIMKYDDNPDGTERYRSGVEFSNSKYNTTTVFLPARLELGQKLQIIITDELSDDSVPILGVTKE